MSNVSVKVGGEYCAPYLTYLISKAYSWEENLKTLNLKQDKVIGFSCLIKNYL